MTEQECLGIDCLWCLNPNCPNERKYMETKELEQKIKDQEIYIVGLKHQIENYQQILDEILQTLKDASYNVISEIPQSQMELTQYTLSVCQAKLCKILDIINKTKGK